MQPHAANPRLLGLPPGTLITILKAALPVLEDILGAVLRGDGNAEASDSGHGPRSGAAETNSAGYRPLLATPLPAYLAILDENFRPIRTLPYSDALGRFLTGF